MSSELSNKLLNFRTLSNVLLDRAQFLRQAGITFNGARDTYQILGYDRIITAKQYRDQYARGGISKRIVEAYPKATWRGGVELFEDEDPDTDTAFEQAWTDIEERFGIWSVFQRADILAGLSTYSVILIGAPGEFDQELPKGGGSPDKLLYFTPFAGGGGPGPNQQSAGASNYVDASIQEFETDATNPRFGQPKTYQLRRMDVSSPMLQKPVHWSRIIHVAEGILDNEVYGQPTLENVWNLLQDLEKVTGGGSEAFWLRANAGMQIDIDKDMSVGDAKIEKAALNEQAEEYKHQLTRILRTRGVSINQLGSDVANFSGPADAILKQIAGSKGIPMRILTGSEMGQLASGQDADNWNTSVMDRRTSYAGPNIVRRLVDRLIDFKYLPKPTVYEVGWPVEENLTEMEKAQGAKAMADVNTAYGAIVFTVDEIREKWYKKEPLELDPIADELTETQKTEGALKMAEVNKTQGAMVFTPTEIRDKWFKLPELTPEQNIPLTAPERVTATAPTPEGDQVGGKGTPPPSAKDAKMIGAGGAGSGNFGHVGRPGELGGSGGGSFDPVKALLKIDHTAGQQRPSASQSKKLHEAYTTIDQMLHDPEIGSQLWATLSGFTPQSLKERINSMETAGGFKMWGGTGDEPKQFRANATGGGRSLDTALNTLSVFVNDSEVGVKIASLLHHAKLSGSWDAFLATLENTYRTAGGTGSGNFGHEGRPGEVGGSGVGGGSSSEGSWKSEGGFENTGIVWKQPVGADGRPIPIKVNSVDEAVTAILAGKVVELPDAASAYTAINKLADIAQEAKAAGKDAKDYDLCQISVANTNMFCAESLRTEQYPNGVPRLEMPQLGGRPVAGSEADKLPRTPWNKSEVDGASAFITHLQGIGVRTTAEVVPAASLKASQSELIGSKVASMMRDKSFDPAKNPVFVSNDNYVVDGHHRWAAVVGRDAENGTLGDATMNIVRVNAPISEVLHLANAWSSKFGIQQNAGVVRQAKGTGLRALASAGVLETELMRVLEAAILSNNTEVIDRLLGLEHPKVAEVPVPISPSVTLNMPRAAASQEPPTVIVNVPDRAAMASRAAKKVEYDAQGRITSIVQEGTTNRKNLEYDASGRISRIITEE